MFWELSSERAFTGLGVGPIPGSQIRMYLGEFCGLPRDIVVWALHLLRELDRTYLKHVERRNRRKSRKAEEGDGEEES